MAKREQIPKSTRFEVFKRDKFTCQYCGASAPDVLLEIDHIKPVSKGGSNEILNLVTSCRDCNRGKSNRELTDASAVKVQKQQLEILQVRREQIEMMLKWKSELADEIEREIDAIESIFIRNTGSGFNAKGRRGMRSNITRFGFEEVYTASEIAIEKYFDERLPDSWEYTFSKVGGICYNRKKARDEVAKQNT